MPTATAQELTGGVGMGVTSGERVHQQQMDIDVSLESSEKPPQQKLVSGREIEEIDGIITAAKLDKEDLQPVSQEILFGPLFSTKEFRLLQLDKGVLESIETGQKLVFRGEENDSAVLCTQKQTYEIKEAETSNSLLLFQDLVLPEVKSSTGSTSSKSPGSSANTSLNSSGLNDSVVIQNELEEECGSNFPIVKSRLIVEVAHSYLEMKRMRPNLSKIRFILRGSEYDGTGDLFAKKRSDGRKLITISALLDKIPASEEEIVEYLEENRILEIDGKLLLVDDDYLFQMFSQVLNCIDENSWSPHEIEKDVVIQTLSSLAKPFFIEKIFQWFFVPAGDGGMSASSSKLKYTYEENKVCRFLGEILLKTMGRFNLKEFMKVWQESVPEGLKVNLSQLSGVACYDEECSPPVIWHFPEYNLPENFTERLAFLFETKKRWKLEEISPFIELFTPPLQNVGNLLTKYARSATVNGIKYYSSKHGR